MSAQNGYLKCFRSVYGTFLENSYFAPNSLWLKSKIFNLLNIIFVWNCALRLFKAIIDVEIYL